MLDILRDALHNILQSPFDSFTMKSRNDRVMNILKSTTEISHIGLSVVLVY